MKKFLKTILVSIFIVTLICLVQKLDILERFALNESDEKLSSYSAYYFKQLQLDEKKIYVRIDEAVKRGENSVFLGVQDQQIITEKVRKAFTAYSYDNPECYYLSNQYTIASTDFKLFQYSILQLEYIISNKDEIAAMNKQIDIAIDKILKGSITEGMSDIDKEIAIHDALVAHVTYYDFKNMNTIPLIKHTAYGALVDKEAVCDGYSKAYKLLLEKVGIESIIITGTTENVPHAWNAVKIDDSYYHVDVTSNKMEKGSKKYVVHTFFNVMDEEITRTHTIDDYFDYPICNSKAYNYYVTKGYYINEQDHLYDRLKDIVRMKDKSELLEIKVDGKYNARQIIDELYNLNFNNWRYSGKTSIEYNKTNDVYVFIK